jgi:hypothetical protein
MPASQLRKPLFELNRQPALRKFIMGRVGLSRKTRVENSNYNNCAISDLPSIFINHNEYL